MRLSITQTYASIQGISSVNTETYHSVTIHLKSRRTDWHTTLNYANLFHIIGTTPYTNLDTSTWKVPKDIQLGDEHFDEPWNIDLLIGCDLFYEILRSDGRTRPVIYPVLKGTFLARHSQVELQPLIHSITHRAYYCSEKTKDWSSY